MANAHQVISTSLQEQSSLPLGRGASSFHLMFSEWPAASHLDAWWAAACRGLMIMWTFSASQSKDRRVGLPRAAGEDGRSDEVWPSTQRRALRPTRLQDCMHALAWLRQVRTHLGQTFHLFHFFAPFVHPS